MTVHFIGAGPGAPDLLTIRARDLIAACPVVLYAGSLVPERVDMLTLVLVGSSETRRVTHGGSLWVYTPRGYGDRSENDLEASA